VLYLTLRKEQADLLTQIREVLYHFKGIGICCVAIFDILKDEEGLPQEQYKHFYAQAEEISKMLFAMIRKLE